ncbi:MAG: hypothetical protein ACYC1P_02910, partial [Gaiellaceae bacterium]
MGHPASEARGAKQIAQPTFRAALRGRRRAGAARDARVPRLARTRGRRSQLRLRRLDGGGGNDVVAGLDGSDTLDGGPGVDTLDYSAA